MLDVSAVQNTWAEFTVSDTGPGFSEAALHHALEPFFTTKGGEGTGLGLAMVYDMVKLAGGRVWIGNTATGGEVRLRLPLRSAPRPLVPGLVLLVEDSPDLRAGIREMLRAQGHAVIEAASVDEALALLAQLPDITLILSDITLEGDATGLDLLDRLPKGHPPCLLMTSLPKDHPCHADALARVPVLAKPFTAHGLYAFVHSGGTQT
jgi:CheY-like chemotaxis protein